MARLFKFSVLFWASWLAGCGGDAVQPHPHPPGDSSTARPAVIPFESNSLETIFKQPRPLQMTLDEQVLTTPRTGDSTVVTLSNSTSFIDYLARLKAAKRIRYDAWELNDLLYNELMHGDREHTISNQSLLDQKIVTEKELKYYQFFFILSLIESSKNPEDAYSKIYTKLNDICKDCIPLEDVQNFKLLEKLKKHPHNFGIFEILSAQQMNSYGIL